MRFRGKTTMAALVLGAVVSASWGQGVRTPATSGAAQGAKAKHGAKVDRSLSTDERLSVLAAALDRKVRIHSSRDCSHLVHAIYERAGFPYSYASSSDLYAGVEGFQRVSQPRPGDLVVWRGHVGIVVRPSRHVFYSFLTAGPGVDDYGASYWLNRGRARFYRYIKSDVCAGCTIARRDSNGLK